MRKQMNGAVADSMFYYGKDYGLNYGVSLPTVRSIANEEIADHDFALYLLKQQVRELKLAAIHIAEPTKLITAEDAKVWAESLINSEIAEECAFALISRASAATDIYKEWVASDNEFAIYAALMTAARMATTSEDELKPVNTVVERFPSSRPIAHGVVALLAKAFLQPTLQESVKSIIAQLGDSASAEYIRDEMSWRMEF